MSKYYQALSKIQTQYNEKLQKEAKEKEASVFKNPVNDKLKSYSNLEKTRDTLAVLRPLFMFAGVIIIGVVFYVGVQQGMLIKGSQPAPEPEPAAEVPAVQEAVVIPALSETSYTVETGSEPAESGFVETGNEMAESGAAAEAAAASSAAAAPESAPPAEEESRTGIPKGKYTLQLVTYTDPALAAEEVERLNKKGYHAFIIPSGRYNQICVNGFDKAAEGRAFQSELQQKGELKRYPGSYVREIPPR